MNGPCDECGALEDNRCICSSHMETRDRGESSQFFAIAKALEVLSGEEVGRVGLASVFARWLESIVDGGGNREKCRKAIAILKNNKA